MTAATRYGVAVAIDLLDRLVEGGSPPESTVVQGAIALALHGADDEDRSTLLRDLEQLALQKRALNRPAQLRAARVASGLRRVVGVH